MKIAKTVLSSIIRESVKNALMFDDEDVPLESVRETSKEKQARREGQKQVVDKLSGKSSEELEAALIKLQQEADKTDKASAKHAFLAGATSQVELLLGR